MPDQKTETLTVRLTPDAKAALREVAGQEQRSLANMLEVMIRWYVAERAADSGRVPPLANSRARE